MPVNMTTYRHVRSRSKHFRRNHSPVKDPRSRVIRRETNGHVVSSAVAYGHHIAADRVHKIRRVATRDPHNIKSMLRKHSVGGRKGG